MPSFTVALVSGGRNVPDWVSEAIAREGIEFVVAECTTRDELARYAGDADVVWLNGGSRILTAENLDAIPRCGAIIRTGSGTDNVAVAAATTRGIIVANTPRVSEEEVSDHAIGLIFAVVRQIAAQDRFVRDGTWDALRAWPLWQMRKKTLGLIGFGHIARCLVRKMSGFELTVLAFDPYVSHDTMAESNVRPATLDEVMAQSDWVSVHCPWVPETYHLIGERELKLMKKTAVLINTARGQILDEPALVRALTEGWIAGAGLDVLEQEPADPNNPLLTLDNVVITPHIAGYSDVYEDNCWAFSLETVLALAHGRWPYSYVNRDVAPRWTLR